MSWIQSAFGTKINPVIVFTIVVLSAVFFISALLHLLIRFFLKHRSDNYPEMPTSGAFQRQLQQLFHLHDSGLDQSSIDSLPVFLYKDVVGLNEHFHCAVCLCEFSELGKLRLLPLCSHAFHIDCIDTWLLSNSTCPLCRGVILSSGFSFENPVFFFDDCKETDGGSSGNDENSSPVVNEKRVFSVRLGKLRSTSQESEAGETSNGDLECRRCYSMGAFQYVVADSDFQVASFPSNGERRGEVRGRGGQIGNFTSAGYCGGDADEKKIKNGAKGESFSVSKIWLWSKKVEFSSSRNTLYCNAI